MLIYKKLEEAIFSALQRPLYMVISRLTFAKLEYEVIGVGGSLIPYREPDEEWKPKFMGLEIKPVYGMEEDKFILVYSEFGDEIFNIVKQHVPERILAESLRDYDDPFYLEVFDL